MAFLLQTPLSVIPFKEKVFVSSEDHVQRNIHRVFKIQSLIKSCQVAEIIKYCL